MNRYQQIVVALLRDELTDSTREQLATFTEADWRGVIGAAEGQAVAPLLLGSVERQKIPAPTVIHDELLASLRNNTARNLQFLKEFEKLAGALQTEGIDFLPLKGIYLCSNVYENLGERSIWDIDLIVPVPELARSLAAIEGTGYRASRPYDPDLERKSYHHLPLYLKPGAPPLEVHWTLLNPRFQHGLDWAALWERSIPAKIGKVSVRAPAAPELLIYLCAHVAYQHVYMDSVRSLYDIKLILARFSDQLDWPTIAERARAWGLLNSVFLTLRLTDGLLGCRIPEAAWQLLRPAEFTEDLTRAAQARMFEEESSPVISAVWGRPTLYQRVRGLWERLMVAPSILAGRYGLPPNSKKVYLYYFVRAKDMLQVHGRSLLNLLLGGQQKREFATRDSELVAYLKWWE